MYHEGRTREPSSSGEVTVEEDDEVRIFVAYVARKRLETFWLDKIDVVIKYRYPTKKKLVGIVRYKVMWEIVDT